MRFPLALIAIAVVVAVASFVADHPGRVEIAWRDWQIETSVGVLAAAAVALGLAVAALVAVLRAVLAWPRRWRAFQRERRRRAGYAALTGGLVALAAGDAEEAQRQARRAVPLLDDVPLSLVLSAEAARLGGDGAAARAAWTAMLDRPATAVIGLRGLFAEAVQQGDHAAALGYAERARRLRASARWAVEGALALQLRAGRWEEARDSLTDAARLGIVPPARARHHRAVILVELAAAAAAQGDWRHAASLAARAQGLAPDLAPATCRRVEALRVLGRIRAARKTLTRAWAIAPHPALAELDADMHRGDPPLARVGTAQALAAANPEAEESLLLVAAAALEARLWGEARRQLGLAVARAGAAGPSRRVCLLMAQLEDGERPGGAAGRDWLARAVAAPPGPRYLCRGCGAEAASWQALCPHCGEFDTLAWTEAPAPPRPAAPPVAVEAPLLPAPSGLAPAGQSDN